MLRLIVYYCKFIRGYASLLSPHRFAKKRVFVMGKNVLVIGTTNNQKSLESSGILDAFSEKLNVGELEAESIKTILENVLDSSGLFQDEDYSSAAEEISRVPIKKLYRALSFAGNDEEEFDSESLNRCMKFLKGQVLQSVNFICFCIVLKTSSFSVAFDAQYL
ncbi:hypothetical protein BUALT_Bualt08G0108400 [Buddleja alternifolia]|uniref:Vesicle-fusing ATPase n=1 Tax=Buddleja alternifolia TaxID=168488 RepID=A0AAV6X6K3_9LAMI|nr:hypothetical protein BUALT_Bualt08G0108400 [Buddleja alternifolia]